MIPVGSPLDRAWGAALTFEAAPVYSHVQGANADSVGIEVAHSGRSDEPFPVVQTRSLAWLLRALLDLSGGRLDPSSITGHKDLDRQPAWVNDRCRGARCSFFADETGRPYRRRVDPPESLFQALAREGLVIPREHSEGDAELLRSEAIAPGQRPRVAAR